MAAPMTGGRPADNVVNVRAPVAARPQAMSGVGDTGSINAVTGPNGTGTVIAPYDAPAPAGGDPAGGSSTPQTPPGPSTNDQNGITVTTATNADGSTSTSSAIDFSTATSIINSALQIVGIDPSQVATSGINAGQTLAQYYWSQIGVQGITDTATLTNFINTTISQTGQFQTAFPGYNEALSKGYVTTVGQYVTAEEGITAAMMNAGVPQDLINPTSVGGLISGGVSTAEVGERLTNGYDAVENAPAEVQNLFSQWFGASGPDALAQLFLTAPDQGGQTYPTLEKMLAGAQIGGAAQASNLTISQGLSQRLADMGQTYQSAQSKFQNLTAEAGLYQQTVGEANKTTDPGTANANAPLSASTTGVEAEFGLSANAQQQVENEALSRQNEFKGGGGGATTEAEGYTGIGPAKSF